MRISSARDTDDEVLDVDPRPRLPGLTRREQLVWAFHRVRWRVPRLVVPVALFGAGVLLTLGFVGGARGSDGSPQATASPPATAPGLAASLPAGTRAVAVPADRPAPPLEPTQRVDVLAPSASKDVPEDAGATPSVEVLARGAVVLAVDDRRISIAVPEAQAPAVVAAVLDGRIALTLAG